MQRTRTRQYVKQKPNICHITHSNEIAFGHVQVSACLWETEKSCCLWASCECVRGREWCYYSVCSACYPLLTILSVLFLLPFPFSPKTLRRKRENTGSVRENNKGKGLPSLPPHGSGRVKQSHWPHTSPSSRFDLQGRKTDDRKTSSANGKQLPFKIVG